MGALTSHSWGREGSFDLSNFDHVSKKQKVSERADNSPGASGSPVYRWGLYPEAKVGLSRAVHAPTKSARFGFSRRGLFGNGRGSSGEKLGDSFLDSVRCRALEDKYAKASREALGTIRHVDVGERDEVREECGIGLEELRDEEKGKEVVVLGNEVTKEDGTEGSSIEEVELEIGNGQLVGYGHQRNLSPGVIENLADGKRGLGNRQASFSSPVNDSEEIGLKLFSLSLDSSKRSKLPHEVLHDSARKRDLKLNDINHQILLAERLVQRHQLLRPQKKLEDVKEDVVEEAFIPLSDEDGSEISRAFANFNRRKILVSHEKSNIDITGEILQCLRPGAWLNDEVINVYLELLKERENREPQKFLKCHFLNTFFYKKLIGGKGGYNFQAVRRWTSQRKLGYYLSECDKIFVPIHKEVHWCLAVINKKEQKFQYLDSLGGRDDNVMKLLGRYYVDEVNDKTGKNIDVSSWEHEFVEDLPEQKNGFDCGVFMIKYTDFYSRGVGLRFKQEHMPYFRQRTVKEILRLKAD